MNYELGVMNLEMLFCDLRSLCIVLRSLVYVYGILASRKDILLREY